MRRDISINPLVARLLRRPQPLIPAIGVRWVFVLGSVFAFGSVARELHRNGSLEFDTRLLRWLRQRQTPRLTSTMRALTQLGSAELLTPLSTLLTLGLWVQQKRRAALFLGVTALGSTLMNQVLKLAFGRERPDSSLQLSRTTGFAFPSGHSMASAAIYGAIAVVATTRFPKLAWVTNTTCSLIVLAVGTSRAYLHVHYPSDVATGWALGLSWPISLQPLILR
ncbi:MAG TPA: phosphatase PAP2 family protein [Polyangiaceae bacterium]|nr:phosphatase PAP2 family protein [Polyangiaceae bacterium]